jgi:PST family polysaccharide transporter
VPEPLARTLKSALLSRTGQQTVSLYASQLVLLAMGVATATLHARVLGPADYGVLAFYMTFTRFVAAFFGFGFFSSSALLLARAGDAAEERRLLGTTLVVALGTGLLYAVLVFLASFWVDALFDTQVGSILRACSPLLVLLPLEPLVAQLARGTNRIEVQAAFNVLSRSLYLLAFGGILLAGGTVSVLALALLQLGSLGVALGVAAARLAPGFDALAETWRKLAATNRAYGVHVYAGQVVNQTSYRLDGILITLFRDTTTLGFYTLATALVSPMALLSRSLSASLFKDFARRAEIPRSVFLANSVWLAACCAALVLAGGFLVTLLFGERYADVTPLILPLAVAGFCAGMYQPYVFLAAKGKGVWIRRTAIVEGVVNVVGGVVLIYLYGALGAAIAAALAKFAHWQMLARYYRKYLAEAGADA